MSKSFNKPQDRVVDADSRKTRSTDAGEPVHEGAPISAESLKASQPNVIVPDRVVNQAMNHGNAATPTHQPDRVVNTAGSVQQGQMAVDLGTKKLLNPGEKPSPYSAGTPNAQTLPAGTVLK